MQISEINEWILQERRAAWNVNHPHGDPPWDFWDGLSRRLRRDADRFGFAIRFGEHLCGLAQGHLSGAGRVIALDHVEGSPRRDHPLKGKIIQIATAVADAYGVLAGAQMLRLMRPTPALVEYYAGERFGFRVVSQAGQDLYCEREILP